MARPTKLDQERTKKIIDLIRAGNYSETAAKASGISPATFYNWMAEGRAAQQKKGKLNAREKSCIEFLEAIEKARAEAEARAVAIINKAAMDGTWQAAAWYLERTAGERYGRTQKIEASVEHKEEKPVSELTDDELLAYLSKHGIGDD